MIVETSRGQSAAPERVVPQRSDPSVPAPRPAERSRGRAGAVRPGGRRPSPHLPAVRPRVTGGRPGTPAAVRVAVTPTIARRRRVAALTLGLVLVALVVAAVSLAHGGAPAGDVPSATVTTVVGAGESLSDVARRAAPGADTASAVERIRELNALPSSAVTAGRPLVVPAG